MLTSLVILSSFCNFEITSFFISDKALELKHQRAKNKIDNTSLRGKAEKDFHQPIIATITLGVEWTRGILTSVMDVLGNVYCIHSWQDVMHIYLVRCTAYILGKMYNIYTW